MFSISEVVDHACMVDSNAYMQVIIIIIIIDEWVSVVSRSSWRGLSLLSGERSYKTHRQRLLVYRRRKEVSLVGL